MRRREGYYDRAHQRLVTSLLQDADRLLGDCEGVGLPEDQLIETLGAIGESFLSRAAEKANG